jgi:hypothetical protein
MHEILHSDRMQSLQLVLTRGDAMHRGHAHGTGVFQVARGSASMLSVAPPQCTPAVGV